MIRREHINIVIVGCGRFSPRFVPLFQAHPVIDRVFVCDTRKDREAAFAEKFGVDMPISLTVEDVLYRGRDPREALTSLFERALKSEF